MRVSNDQYENGRLMNGYDYDRQAWVSDGRYVRCGHPQSMDCKCYGKEHEGEDTPSYDLAQGYTPSAYFDEHDRRETFGMSGDDLDEAIRIARRNMAGEGR